MFGKISKELSKIWNRGLFRYITEMGQREIKDSFKPVAYRLMELENTTPTELNYALNDCKELALVNKEFMIDLILFMYKRMHALSGWEQYHYALRYQHCFKVLLSIYFRRVRNNPEEKKYLLDAFYWVNPAKELNVPSVHNRPDIHLGPPTEEEMRRVNDIFRPNIKYSRRYY